MNSHALDWLRQKPEFDALFHDMDSCLAAAPANVAELLSYLKQQNRYPLKPKDRLTALLWWKLFGYSQLAGVVTLLLIPEWLQLLTDQGREPQYLQSLEQGNTWVMDTALHPAGDLEPRRFEQTDSHISGSIPCFFDQPDQEPAFALLALDENQMGVAELSSGKIRVTGRQLELRHCRFSAVSGSQLKDQFIQQTCYGFWLSGRSRAWLDDIGQHNQVDLDALEISEIRAAQSSSPSLSLMASLSATDAALQISQLRQQQAGYAGLIDGSPGGNYLPEASEVMADYTEAAQLSNSLYQLRNLLVARLDISDHQVPMPEDHP